MIGSFVKGMFNLLRNWQLVIQSGSTILHDNQQYIE